MTETSNLGSMIEAAVERDARYQRLRPSIKYLCFFETLSGIKFAFERVTKTHINLWLPEIEAVRVAAEAAGLPITLTLADPKPDAYGRISSLKSIPELRDARLYRVPARTVGEALTVLSALP